MKTGRPRSQTNKHKEKCRAAAILHMQKRTIDPTLQEIYGPVPPTMDNPKGLGLAALERAKREGWSDVEEHLR